VADGVHKAGKWNEDKVQVIQVRSREAGIGCCIAQIGLCKPTDLDTVLGGGMHARTTFRESLRVQDLMQRAFRAKLD